MNTNCDSVTYSGTKPSSRGGKFVCLMKPDDSAQCASIGRDGTLSWVPYGNGGGYFEAFLLANPASVSNLAAVQSSNPGEPLNWHNPAVFDLSKA